MIDFETFSKIRHFHDQQGMTMRQIAKILHLDSRTVANWIGERHFKPRRAAIRSSKLDPYKALILSLLESHPYTATQIFQRISEEGFIGGYWIVKNYIRKVRPKRTPAFLK